MASWERHGEESKYAGASKESNSNPRHVGAPLRTISMEERIEERRIAKENQRKGAVHMELSESEEEAPKPAEASQASSPAENLKATSTDSTKAASLKAASTDSTDKKPENGTTLVEPILADAEPTSEVKEGDAKPAEVLDDDDVVAAVVTEVAEVVPSAKASRKSGARELVEDLDAVAPKKKPRASTSGGKEKSPQGKSPQGKSPKRVVEDLDAVPVVELEDGSSPNSAAAARKARRKALAAKAKAKPSRPAVHVLE